jgi:hypothetical protein
MPLQVRRGTEAERLAMTQPLAQGELLYVTNEQKLYIGNGSTLGGIQITGYTDSDAKDAAASIFASGAHTGISFSYNNTTDAMSATVDFANISGVVRADAFKGSVFADDGSTIGGTLLVDAVDGVLRGTHIGTLIGNVTGNIFTNLIDSADSTAITFTPAVVFNSDITVENEIFGTLVGRHVGAHVGNVQTEVGQTIIDGTTRAANLSGINLDPGGIIGSPDGIALLPTTQLTSIVEGADPGIPKFIFQTNNNSNYATAALGLSRGRGTTTAPTVVQLDDEIANLMSLGFDGNEYFPSATIGTYIDGSVSPGVVPTRIEIYVTNASGVTAAPVKFRSTQTEFIVPPKLPVVANDAARTSLVSSATAGMMIFMQSGTTPAATNKVQVFDGSAWVNLH